MCESLNLIIVTLHCSVVKLKAIIRRSEVESSRRCSLTALHTCIHDVQVRCPAEKKIVISDVFDVT